MLGRFNRIFGIKEELAAEQRRFVQRINQTAFRQVENQKYQYRQIFESVCYSLGINAQDRIGDANRANYFGDIAVPGLRSLTEDDFMETLKVLVLLHQTLKGRELEGLTDWIKAALNHANIDIGVRWRDGMFYPSGAKELDERLVEEPFEWLDAFPKEKVDYLNAVSSYTHKEYAEVIGNCYLVIEGLARSVLKNARTLDNNREDLMKKIGLSQNWKGLLSNFINYANEFKRHAAENRHDVNPIEVEGFLYLTGLLVRMIVEAVR